MTEKEIIGFCIRCECDITKDNLGGGQGDGRKGHATMICVKCLHEKWAAANGGE